MQLVGVMNLTPWRHYHHHVYRTEYTWGVVTSMNWA